MEIAVIDFETEGIQARPVYPPRAVGVAIKLPHRPAHYYAWGHPTGNNCTMHDAFRALRDIVRRGMPIVMHNAKFDLAVLSEGLGVDMPANHAIHDTMLLAFLNNPYEPTLALKPLAEKHLNLPPTERDAVRDWLVANRVCRANDKQWGAYIALAPGDLVGEYAIGDVDRTAKLFALLRAAVVGRNMGAAYDRERYLIPLLMENERMGVRVDIDALESDYSAYETAMGTAEVWLRDRLGRPDMNLDSDAQMADALESCGIVTDFALTATGKPSVSKATLTKDKFSDEQVFQVLGYRNRLQTCMGTFMGPWLETARKSRGRIFTNWRQIGATTGRMSSSPNFQNISKSWVDKPDGYVHPSFLALPELPLLRKYILPEEGHILIAADYAGQEVRVAAHFEDGALMEAYCADPRLDPHTFVQRTIKELTGRDYERRVCKMALFATLYGAGGTKLGSQLGISVAEGAQIKEALFAALPGIRAVDEELKHRAKIAAPFRTAGGREYFAEPPKFIDGAYRTFDYKCLNTIVQGSSADMTKAAMLRYDAMKRHGSLLLFVHDEIVLSVPEEHAQTEAAILINAMESAMPLDVPIIAEAKIGRNFASMETI